MGLSRVKFLHQIEIDLDQLWPVIKQFLGSEPDESYWTAVGENSLGPAYILCTYKNPSQLQVVRSRLN